MRIPSLELAFQVNSARYIGIPQLFLTVGIYAGPALLEGAELKLGGEEKEALGLCFGGYLGIMKKYYIRRLALVGEGRYNVHRLYLYGSFEDQELSYTQEARLISFLGGLELALREDLNIGVSAGYMVGRGKRWTEEWRHKEEKEIHNLTGPEAERRGGFFGLHIVYSPPTL